MWKTCAFAAIGIAAAAMVAGCFGNDKDDPGLIGGLIEASQQAQAQQQAEAEAMAKQMEAQMRQQMEAEMSGQPLPQPAPTAAPAPGMTGVAECDEYITKYPQCVQSSAPAMAKASMMAGFEATKQGWLEMAKTPEARQPLQMSCQIALTQAKATMKIYGCNW